jgi:hypothetical protein
MTRWLDAARKAKGPSKEHPPQAPSEPVLSVVSVLSEGVNHQPPEQQPPEAFPYGSACGLGEMPRTWTGRVVSIADWRNLTDWDRHGPNGKLWCGKRKEWVRHDG